jgi:hypothetical protein
VRAGRILLVPCQNPFQGDQDAISRDHATRYLATTGDHELAVDKNPPYRRSIPTDPSLRSGNTLGPPTCLTRAPPACVGVASRANVAQGLQKKVGSLSGNCLLPHKRSSDRGGRARCVPVPGAAAAITELLRAP